MLRYIIAFWVLVLTATHARAQVETFVLDDPVSPHISAVTLPCAIQAVCTYYQPISLERIQSSGTFKFQTEGGSTYTLGSISSGGGTIEGGVYVWALDGTPLSGDDALNSMPVFEGTVFPGARMRGFLMSALSPGTVVGADGGSNIGSLSVNEFSCTGVLADRARYWTWSGNHDWFPAFCHTGVESRCAWHNPAVRPPGAHVNVYPMVSTLDPWPSQLAAAYVTYTETTMSLYVDLDVVRVVTSSAVWSGTKDTTDGFGSVNRVLWATYELRQIAGRGVGGGIDGDCCEEIVGAINEVESAVNSLAGLASGWREGWENQDTWIRGTMLPTLVENLEEIQSVLRELLAAPDPASPLPVDASEIPIPDADELGSASKTAIDTVFGSVDIGINPEVFFDGGGPPVWTFTLGSVWGNALPTLTVNFAHVDWLISVLRLLMMVPVVIWAVSMVWDEFRRY